MLEDPTLIDAVGTVTAAAALYVARMAKSFADVVEDHETAIYGTEQEDGNIGVAQLAVDADRRSRSNEDRIETVAEQTGVAVTDGGTEPSE